ncbi:MAG: M23 family metallopeptidase [Betaproteobacteria bacterium]|nr:M23 family metallopeptidase [Betaproteobacteria bacterium]
MSIERVAILAQRLVKLLPARQLAFGALLLGLPAIGVVTAFGIAPGSFADTLERTAITAAVPIPELVPHELPAVQRFASQERVLRGDTVAGLIARLGIADDAALAFLRTDPVGRQIFRQLIPGRIMQAETDESGGLVSLRYFVGPANVLEVARGPDGYSARMRAAAALPRAFYKSATIKSSLFAATDAAGIPDAIAMQLARVFATDIDFHVDIRSGDRFSVIYEMAYEGGELVAPGRILAAEFVNQGRTYTAVLFHDEEDNDAYYELDGASRAKAFLRSPVEFSRVSSGFGRRFHPIFNNWRAHTGTDFAAPKGTRVLSVADGQVVFAGWRNGYGNTLEVRHGGSISTLYAHLSGFSPGMRAGARVRQGDPIAFVGATGWATGPHLHYEFKMSGIQQDPMKVALPKATPVPARLKARFDAEAADAGARIAMIRATTSLRFE